MVLIGTTGDLMTVVDGELVHVEVKQGWFGTRYRLFVADVEVRLRVEAGESPWFLSIPRPRLLSAPPDEERRRLT